MKWKDWWEDSLYDIEKEEQQNVFMTNDYVGNIKCALGF